MLTITPCFETPVVARCCAMCGKPYSAAFYVYRAENRGQTLATALFEVSGDRVSVLLYEAEETGDFALFDGVLRAGFHYASDQGIENGDIPEEFHDLHHDLFTHLNYPIQPVFNITNFFQKYKNCTDQ